MSFSKNLLVLTNLRKTTKFPRLVPNFLPKPSILYLQIHPHCRHTPLIAIVDRVSDEPGGRVAWKWKIARDFKDFQFVRNTKAASHVAKIAMSFYDNFPWKFTAAFLSVHLLIISHHHKWQADTCECVYVWGFVTQFERRMLYWILMRVWENVTSRGSLGISLGATKTRNFILDVKFAKFHEVILEFKIFVWPFSMQGVETRWVFFKFNFVSIYSIFFEKFINYQSFHPLQK